MGLAAAGAGAAEGLKDFLLQMLREGQLKDEQARTAESSRHNQATEGLTGQQVEATRSYRDQLQRQNDIKENEVKAEHQRTEANRQRDDIVKNLDELMPDVMITPETRKKAVDVGVPQERFKDVKAFDPEDFVGPVPSDVGLPGPQRGEVIGYQQQNRGPKVAAGRAPELKPVTLNGKVVDANYDAQGRLMYRGEDITDKAEHYTAPSVSFIQSGDNYAVGDRHSGKITPTDAPLATPAATRTRQDLAERVGEHFDDIQHMIDDAEKRGLLGPLAGRTFNEFMAGKVGTTGNAQDDELLGELRQNLSLARSGLAQLHGRGGANVGIVQNLEKNMDAGHMSYNELTGGLRAMKTWVDTYAKKKGTGAEPKANGGDDLYQQYLNRPR